MKTEKQRKRDCEYSKKWYEANRLYKRTYQRFYRRVVGNKCNLTERGATNVALDEIIRDRRDQIKAGRWINERTGEIYHGIAGM